MAVSLGLIGSGGGHLEDHLLARHRRHFDSDGGRGGRRGRPRRRAARGEDEEHPSHGHDGQGQADDDHQHSSRVARTLRRILHGRRRRRGASRRRGSGRPPPPPPRGRARRQAPPRAWPSWQRDWRRSSSGRGWRRRPPHLLAPHVDHRAADLDLVPGVDGPLVDTLAVDGRAVATAEVLDEEVLAAREDARVAGGRLLVVEDDIGIGGAADDVFGSAHDLEMPLCLPGLVLQIELARCGHGRGGGRGGSGRGRGHRRRGGGRHPRHHRLVGPEHQGPARVRFVEREGHGGVTEVDREPVRDRQLLDALPAVHDAVRAPEVDDLVDAPVADHFGVVAGAGLALEDDVVVGVAAEADPLRIELMGRGLASTTGSPDLDHRYPPRGRRMLP